MKQLKSNDVKIVRERWHKEQNYICPLLNKYVELSDVTLDHQHKLKSELPDESGKGLCRGAIHFQANSFEGKVMNSYKRLGLNKFIDLPSLLRNLANYLENNKIHTDEKYIHPSEKIKSPKLKKSSYNKLKKVCKTKMPEYTGNYTKKLKELFEKYEIDPDFY